MNIKFVLLGCIMFSLLACAGGGSDKSSASSSSASAAAGSHNAGQDCLSSGCHGVGIGGGGPEFYVGGTIYKSDGLPQANATIRLYVKDTNTLVASLHTDESGNFYTANTIKELHIPSGDAVVGVNVELEGPNGGIQTMPGVVADAYCNKCHVAGQNGRLVAN